MSRLLKIIGIVLFTCCSSFAAELEIKVEQKPIKLPYWPATEPSHGALVFVRGGQQPQWSESLASLAQLLAKSGWSVLMLNASPEISVPWIKQLPEAITVLRQAKNKRIVMVHYGEELNQTLDYFSKPQGKTINGMVFLSAYDDKESTVTPDNLSIQIFDIVSQFDYDAALKAASDRKASFQQGMYLFMELPGAYHDYTYNQNLLVSFLSGWMLKLPETVTNAPPMGPNGEPLVEFYIEPVYSLSSYFLAIN